MKDPRRLRSWALELQTSRGHNVATVALANKLARAVWSVWKNERTYEARLKEGYQSEDCLEITRYGAPVLTGAEASR